MKINGPSTIPKPKPRPDPKRRRIFRAVRTWAALTLSGVVVVSTLIVWLLIRRGRSIRDGRVDPFSKSKPVFRDPLDC